MTSARGTTNSNVRGSAAQRRIRKRRLLERDGDGLTAPCWECRTPVTADTMVCDRVRTGIEGGRYQLGNLRVHCHACSARQGHRMGLESRRWRTWNAQGLHRSRVSPEGTRHLDRWHVTLADHYVGFVRRSADGWEAYGRELATYHSVAAGAVSLAAALYALLTEHTIGEKAA